MKENNTFREKRKQNDLKLIAENKIFNSDKGKKPYFIKSSESQKGIWKQKADLLLNGKNNLYAQIANKVILYFALNQILFPSSR